MNIKQSMDLILDIIINNVIVELKCKISNTFKIIYFIKKIMKQRIIT